VIRPEDSKRHINKKIDKVDEIFDEEKNWTSINYLPDEQRNEDLAKVRLINKMKWEAGQHRAQYTSNWLRYWNFYRSRQWPTRRISWRAYLVINYIFATIENIVATMTDNRPKINLLPADKSQADYVDTLQALLDTIWRRRNVLFTVQNALRNAMIFGTGFLKVFWNEDLEDGKGDIDVSSPDPTTIYVDPGATSFEDAEWVLWSDTVSMDHIRRNYPDKAKFVRPGIAEKDWRDERRVYQQAGSPLYENVDFVSPVRDRLEVIDNTEYSSPPTKVVGQKSRDRVRIIEAWFIDDEMEVTTEMVKIIDPITEEMTLQPKIMKRPKYPNGRLITIAGDIVLQDVPSPYLHGMWPFVRIVDNSIPNEFYGVGEVELLEDLQKELNKRRSQVIDYANLLGNGIWVIDHDSGVDPDKITNRPGLIITKMPGREVRREAGPEIPHYLVGLQEQTLGDMQAITGIHDTLGGQIPRGVRTGAGMIEAQDIASTRLRLKVRNLEYSLARVGRLMIALIQQYYSPPRVVRILGKDGGVEFYEIDGNILRGDWDIIVGTGSTLPVSKSLRFEQAVRLYQMEAIDQPALLEAADWPGKEEIVKRMTGEPWPDPVRDEPDRRENKGPSQNSGAQAARGTEGIEAEPAFSQTFDQPPM
jgi:hypothetical protein